MSNNDHITLRQYLEGQLAAADRLYGVQLQALTEAIAKAEKRLDVRLQAMNEFRAALEDQSQRVPTRQEVEQKFDALSDKYEPKCNADSRLKSLEVSRAWQLGAAAAVAAIVAVLFRAVMIIWQ